jgi:hypothetical protein
MTPVDACDHYLRRPFRLVHCSPSVHERLLIRLVGFCLQPFCAFAVSQPENEATTTFELFDFFLTCDFAQSTGLRTNSFSP